MTDTSIFPGPAARTWPGPQQFSDGLLRMPSVEELALANMPAFIRLVVRQREAMRLTQRKASALCELTAMTFCHVERGLYLPSAYVIGDMLYGLGLTRADLLAEIRAMEDEDVTYAQAA